MQTVIEMFHIEVEKDHHIIKAKFIMKVKIIKISIIGQIFSFQQMIFLIMSKIMEFHNKMIHRL
jgi:hypothetical protein